jgi:transposase-like protein
MLNYRYKACQPKTEERIIKMAINGSGIRDTARVLGIHKNTVMRTLKKSLPFIAS